MLEHVFATLARTATVSALALATSIGASGVAVAASPEDHPIEVSLGASGLQAPDSAKGGLVSFRVKTDDPNGRQLQLLRPHDGVTADQVFQDLAKAVSPTPDAARTGIRAVREEADLLGGALVTPQVHEQFTEEIAPGPVYLLDLTALRSDPAHPVAKELILVGTSGQSANQTRFDDGMVIQKDTADGPRFQTEDVDHAHLAYLVHDESEQIHEMELRPVGADTTEEQVGQYLRDVQLGLLPVAVHRAYHRARRHVHRPHRHGAGARPAARALRAALHGARRARRRPARGAGHAPDRHPEVTGTPR